jgi:hypothetical protein
MRLALLAASSLSPFNLAVLEDLRARPGLDIVCAALDVRPAVPLGVRLRRHFRKGRGLYLGVMVFAQLGTPPGTDARGYFADRDVPTLPFSGYGDPGFLAALAAYAPDVLVLLGGYGIVKKELLDFAPHGVLSYHHGDMRRYRGQPPAFWEVARREAAMGVTVQRLCERLDAGTPVAELAVPIAATDSPGQVSRRAYAASVPLMGQALERLAAQDAPQPLDRLGQVYTLPNFRQWLVCHARVALARARASLGAAGTGR